MLWLAFGGIFLIWDSLLRFALLCIRALKAPAKKPLNCGEEVNGVVLIAAHNEAGTIGPTICSLKACEDEWTGLQIWVVADRCSDNTAQEAASAGAQVAIRQDGSLGKGAVLAWWLKQYRSAWTDHDCLIVLDADSRLAQGSVTAFRNVMQQGIQVAQGFVAPLTVNNAGRSGRLGGWSEVLMQRIDDEARQRCHWSVPLRGTGMVFRAPLLAQLAPRLHTLAEDLELDCLLAAQGTLVSFIPEACIYDPKPVKAAGASRQRARWLQGQLQVLRDYPGSTLRALTSFSIGNWFLLCLLFLRPKMLLLALRFFGVLCGFIAWKSWFRFSCHRYFGAVFRFYVLPLRCSLCRRSAALLPRYDSRAALCGHVGL